MIYLTNLMSAQLQGAHRMSFFFSSCFEDVSQDFVQGRLLGCPIENQTYLKRRSASYVGKTAKIFLEAESEDTT